MRKQPLMLTPIAAGFPSPAEDKVDTNLNLHTYVVKKPEATFFMRVSGDSMEGVGIFNGDIAVVDKSIEPKSGDIVVAHVNGEFTLKTFKYKGGEGWLLPANDNYEPIKVSSSDDFSVWGVLTYTLRGHRGKA